MKTESIPRFAHLQEVILSYLWTVTLANMVAVKVIFKTSSNKFFDKIYKQSPSKRIASPVVTCYFVAFHFQNVDSFALGL